MTYPLNELLRVDTCLFAFGGIKLPRRLPNGQKPRTISLALRSYESPDSDILVGNCPFGTGRRVVTDGAPSHRIIWRRQAAWGAG